MPTFSILTKNTKFVFVSQHDVVITNLHQIKSSLTMIQIENINTPCLQTLTTTSSSSWMNGPHALSPPSTPRKRLRTHPGSLLMDNLEKLSAPSLVGGGCSPSSKSVMSGFRPAPSCSNPASQLLFNNALQRMQQNGPPLFKKLKEQRDETTSSPRTPSSPTTRFQGLSLSSEHEKVLTGSPRVSLARQPPERSHSGIARSA